MPVLKQIVHNIIGFHKINIILDLFYDNTAEYAVYTSITISSTTHIIYWVFVETVLHLYILLDGCEQTALLLTPLK
jgi:hypothetical protein